MEKWSSPSELIGERDAPSEVLIRIFDDRLLGHSSLQLPGTGGNQHEGWQLHDPAHCLQCHGSC